MWSNSVRPFSFSFLSNRLEFYSCRYVITMCAYSNDFKKLSSPPKGCQCIHFKFAKKKKDLIYTFLFRSKPALCARYPFTRCRRNMRFCSGCVALLHPNQRTPSDFRNAVRFACSRFTGVILFDFFVRHNG